MPSPTCSSKGACSRHSHATARSSCRCARCSSRWARRSRTIRRARWRRFEARRRGQGDRRQSRRSSINGESRPLDVPPIVYNGVVMVPIRVISEDDGRLRAVGARSSSRRGAIHPGHAAAGRTEAPPPPPVPTATLAPPPPTPNPLKLGGYFRSYYFTRQNASNNPGTQFNFSPGAKYNSNGVNQATWNSADRRSRRLRFPAPAAGTSAARTSTRIRSTDRASCPPTTPRAPSASRRRRRTRTPTIRCRASR